MPHARAYHTRRQQARQTRQRQAKRRRLEQARAHLQREQARAQRHLRALEQALVDLGLPETLAAALEWRLKPMGKLLGNIFGLMFPTWLGCQTTAELTRVRRWDKNLPGKLLGALPKRKWVRRWQRMGQERLVRWWRQVEDKSPAPRSRWPWTWAADDRVFKKSGTQLSLVGRWWSGQEHRVRLGIDGLLLVVVIGDGKLVVPVDFEVRRPDPVGPGGPCRDQLTWLQVMLDRTWAALRRRCRRLPPPLVVAASWLGDSKVIGHVATHRQGTLLVEGKRTQAFQLPDGRRVKGHAFRTRDDWPWPDSAQLPGVRQARLTASSPTSGMGTVVIIDAPGEERFYLRCRATAVTAPRLIRAWRRRSAMEHFFRILKHLLAPEACQVQTEAAYDGHLVLRLLAGLVLWYTSRVLDKSRVTMEALVFSLKHHWRFLTSETLELHGLSWDLPWEVA